MLIMDSNRFGFGNAQVRLDHLFVLADGSGAALGDLLPEIEYGNHVGNPHDQFHMVLDDEQRDTGPLDVADDAREVTEFSVVCV